MSRQPVPRCRVASLALLLFPAAALALSTPGLALAQSQDLARSLIDLRGQVEQINGELELLREEQRTAFAGLGMQRAELAASVERQQLAVRELRVLRLASSRSAPPGSPSTAATRSASLWIWPRQAALPT